MPKTTKLVSRRNTRRVRDLVIYAAQHAFEKKGILSKVREVAFRGGRWEVTVSALNEDHFFEVVDAEPGQAGTGLDFRKL